MVKMPRLPIKTLSSLLFPTPSGFEKGIVHLVLLVMLAAGIGLGTYLVQNNTNILPFAAENTETGPTSVPDAAVVDDKTFKNTLCEVGKNRMLRSADYEYNWQITSCSTNCSKDTDCPISDKVASGLQPKSRKCVAVNEQEKFCVGLASVVKAAASTAGKTTITVETATGAIPTPKEDFTPKPNKLATLKKFLSGEIAGKVTCEADNKLWVVADNPTNGIPAREFIIDCSKEALGAYKGETKCGRSSTSADAEYGCFDASLKTSGSAGSTPQDANSSQGSVIVGANKPISDKISPELAKLAADCGLKDAGENTLGIPFYKIGFGNNPSINREECKGLLETQLKYFDEANKESLRKLMDAAEKINATVQKKEDGTYAVVASSPDKISSPEVVALAKKVEEVNQANKSVADCKGKTGTEQANCLGGAQEKIQTAATSAQSEAVKSYMTKFKQILDGTKKSGCVKADLGIAPFMEAKRLKARGRGADPATPADGGEANDKGRRTFHRLLLCTGKSGDLKWRVLVGGEAGEKFSGTDGTIDEGNDAERLYGLHGTTDDAKDAPNYGTAGFKINECITLTGQTKESVLKDLDKYIKAAGGLDGSGAVSANMPECKKPSIKEDTGGNGSDRRSGSSTKPAAGGGSTGTSTSGTGTTNNTSGSGAGTGSSSSGGGTSTSPKTECDTNAGCASKGPDWICRENKCKYEGTDCRQSGSCPSGKACRRDTGQCVVPASCPGGVCI